MEIKPNALTPSQIKEMIAAQNEFDKATQFWKNADSMTIARAIYCLAATLLESWLPGNEFHPNKGKSHRMLVSIWGFIMTHAERHMDTHAMAAGFLAKHCKAHAPVTAVDGAKLLSLIDTFISKAANGHVNVHDFACLVNAFGLRWPDIHRKYIGISALHRYRAAHGTQGKNYDIEGIFGLPDDQAVDALLQEVEDVTVDKAIAIIKGKVDIRYARTSNRFGPDRISIDISDNTSF